MGGGGEYQLRLAVPARLAAPVGCIGVECDEREIIRADYLPKSARALPPQNYLADEAAKQLGAYFAKPRAHRFDLPLRRAATHFQQKVREVLESVPPGEVITYKQVALQIKSHQRAVGGACRANNVCLIVPCHRVVAAGGVGGFGGGASDSVTTKRWLLNLESGDGRWTTTT